MQSTIPRVIPAARQRLYMRAATSKCEAESNPSSRKCNHQHRFNNCQIAAPRMRLAEACVDRHHAEALDSITRSRSVWTWQAVFAHPVYAGSGSDLLHPLRQQLERRNVTRSKNAEMPAVERCKLRFPQTLSNRQYGSINEANICVSVLVA